MLGRAPDAAGASYWQGQLAAGRPDDGFCAGLLASDEYFARHGGDANAWLNAAYDDLLGRTPDADGRAFWTNTLAHGASRPAVATDLVHSAEAHVLVVRAGFDAVLGRAPEDSAVSYWQTRLDAGMPPLGFVAELASSGEFATRVASGPLPLSSGLRRPSGGLLVVAPPEPLPDIGRGGDAPGRGEAPFLGGLAPEPERPGDLYGAGNLLSMAPGIAPPNPSGFSAHPVRYFDGVVKLSFTDLESQGYGAPYGVTRSWSNASDVSETAFGNDVVPTNLPYLIVGVGTVTEVANGYSRRYFDDVGGGTYVERYYAQDTFVVDATNQEYVLTDTTGTALRFHDVTVGAQYWGRFKSRTDPAGNVTSVVGYNLDGTPTEVQRSNTTGGTTVTESFLYSYTGGKATSVTLRRQVNSGSWTTVRSVDYTYYDGTESYGNSGDLKTAVVKDGSGNTIDTNYYRYYTSSSSTGYVGGLKYVFRPASYARLVAALGTSLSSLTDTQVAPYADNYFEYDSSQRVTLETVQGVGCSGCMGGFGTYTYAYTTSTNSDGLNSWKRKTVETLPDGNSNIVYTNAAGQVMLFIYHDDAANDDWMRFTRYDDEGRAILIAEPSAISGYDDTYADLLNKVSGNYQYLNDSTGLVQVWDFASSTTATSTTAGDADGYEKAMKVRQGETGSDITVTARQYFSRAASSATIYPTANATAYANTNTTGGRTTSYSYTWQGSTAEAESITTTKPTVSSTQNGPGSADTSTVYLDVYGRGVWTKDGDGYLTYTAFDHATGAVTKQIVDVDTTQTSDFANLPSGWSTPTGGGLHLKTLQDVDGLGRTTKRTDPAGNITYTVYKDADQEVRVYPGWNTSSNAPTGPTQVMREDRPGSYRETLTMSATPSLTSGVPNGTESIGSIQTLSRAYYFGF